MNWEEHQALTNGLEGRRRCGGRCWVERLMKAVESCCAEAEVFGFNGAWIGKHIGR